MDKNSHHEGRRRVDMQRMTSGKENYYRGEEQTSTWRESCTLPSHPASPRIEHSSESDEWAKMASDINTNGRT